MVWCCTHNCSLVVWFPYGNEVWVCGVGLLLPSLDGCAFACHVAGCEYGTEAICILFNRMGGHAS